MTNSLKQIYVIICDTGNRALLSENVKIKTQPEKQPIATVVPDIAVENLFVGRYSWGSLKRSCPSKVIQQWSCFKPYPIRRGGDKLPGVAVQEALPGTQG
jgi:hypothetical protein